jgi:hypothetical protein
VEKSKPKIGDFGFLLRNIRGGGRFLCKLMDIDFVFESETFMLAKQKKPFL